MYVYVYMTCYGALNAMIGQSREFSLLPVRPELHFGIIRADGLSVDGFFRCRTLLVSHKDVKCADGSISGCVLCHVPVCIATPDKHTIWEWKRIVKTNDVISKHNVTSRCTTHCWRRQHWEFRRSRWTRVLSKTPASAAPHWTRARHVDNSQLPVGFCLSRS